MYENFEHQADAGVRGIGKSLEESFQECARALYALMTDLSKVKQEREFKFSCVAENNEELLVEFLNKLITDTSTNNYFYSKFRVEIKSDYLTCTAWGERINPKKHELLVEVKAATYSQLLVEFKKGKWIAQTIVDV